MIRTHVLLAAGLSSCLATAAFAQKPFARKMKHQAEVQVQPRFQKVQLPGFAPAARPLAAGPKALGRFSTPVQPLSGGRLAADNPAVLTIVKSSEGLPILIEGPAPTKDVAAPNARLDVTGASYGYLNGLKKDLQIGQAEKEFEITNIENDALNQTHIRLKQKFNGLEVYGSEVLLHEKNSAIYLLNGRFFPTPKIQNLQPSIAEARAIALATAELKKRTTFAPLTGLAKDLLKYEDPAAKLVIYHPNAKQDAERLTWHVVTRPNALELWDCFLDAQTGQLLHTVNNTCSADGARTATGKDLAGITRSISTYLKGTTYYMIDASRPMFNSGQSQFPNDPVGVIWTVDARNTAPGDNFDAAHLVSANNAWTSAAGISAHYNGGEAYKYFLDKHARKSLNGADGRILSFINVADEDGKGLDNAFWNGAAIFYGNGRIGFKPLAAALDVAGHEMTHGVISNSAKLEYQGESGAINESMADVFGVLMDVDGDWKIGEDVTLKSYIASGCLRDLADPHNGATGIGKPGYQPRHVNEQYTGTEDNGGVHINSGIPNFAFYKIATAIGKPNAEKIYYRALANYLTKSSQFIDLRLAVVKAATDLHGATSTEVNAVKTAFDAVGITDGTASQPEPDLPTNNGNEFVLAYNITPGSDARLFVASLSPLRAAVLSNTELKNRPSVLDNGEAILFVDKTSRLRAITVEDEPQEQVIEQNTIWGNVAVSKDGGMFAAVTNMKDGKIYVASTQDDDKVEAFDLYNPTYTDGITTGEVLYADALEWDHTGQYLMYDAYNRISTNDGGAIEYWDIGFIHVWDNETNDFADGSIEKLFSNLPENVSIGNPVFSRNTPHIIAFDYVDEVNEEYAVMGANLETGEIAKIVDNVTIGYPSYNRLDNKIVYTTLSTGNDTIVATVNLKADKITGNGSPTALFSEVQSKWGTFLVLGSRDNTTPPPPPFPTGTDDEPTTKLEVYPNPFASNLTIGYPGAGSKPVDVTVLNVFGQELRKVRLSASGVEARTSIDLNDLAPGTYLLKVSSGSKVDVRRIIKR